ncbi:MAG: PKD domain-containing protein, partial [Gammaproteobacteria bacterium]
VVDMGTSRPVGGFRYLPRQGSSNGRIGGYRFYVSTNGVNWGTPVAQGTFANTATEKTVTFSVAPLALDPIASPPRTAGTPVTYTAVPHGGVNPRFSWSFGDGSAATAPATTPGATHTFAQPGRYTVTVTATDDVGANVVREFVQAVHHPLTATPPTVSMSIAYEDNRDRVWNVNPDNDTATVFDALTEVKVAEIAVGQGPRSVAVAPDGRIWVANQQSASISIIAPDTLQVVQTAELPAASQPYGLVFDSAGSQAFVALESMGLLLRLAPTTGVETGRVAVGPNPRHLSVNADGTRVFVSRFITPPVPGEATAAPNTSSRGGEVVVVDSSSLAIVKTVVLQHSEATDTTAGGRGVPNYLGPAVIAPDGRSAWVPSKQDNIKRGILRDGRQLTFETTLRAISSRIDLASLAEDYPARMDHDNSGVAGTALFNPTSDYLFVALEASREVAVIDPYSHHELMRFNVGRAPQGLSLSSDGSTLYVQNFMDRTVGVYDIEALVQTGDTRVGLIKTYSSVAVENLPAQVLLGKQLFYDARDPRLARDRYISCAACHHDGGHDGRVWDLTGFGEGLRNTISLRGQAGTAHGRLHWSSNFDEVQDFEQQIRGLAAGTGLMSDSDFNAGTRSQSLGDPKAGSSADLDALAAYVASLNSFVPSPHRNADGTLTADAVAGETVFQIKDCAQCHSGSNLTDSITSSDTLHDIGTQKLSSGRRLGDTLTGIDTPTLRGVWASAPYLHDGSAATLSDAVSAHEGITVTPFELDRLSSYLQQLDSRTD